MESWRRSLSETQTIAALHTSQLCLATCMQQANNRSLFADTRHVFLQRSSRRRVKPGKQARRRGFGAGCASRYKAHCQHAAAGLHKPDRISGRQLSASHASQRQSGPGSHAAAVEPPARATRLGTVAELQQRNGLCLVDGEEPLPFCSASPSADQARACPSASLRQQRSPATAGLKNG